MKKIIELANEVCNDLESQDGIWLDSAIMLRDAINVRRKLEQTPITEDWLKEHGFKCEHYGTWSKILNQWKDCDNFTHTVGVAVSSQNIHFTIQGELQCVVNADSKGFLSKSINSLADLYDAMELCEIKMED